MYQVLLVLLLGLIIGVLFHIVYRERYEGFQDITAQTSKILSITDVIADPEDAETVADPFYERLNSRNTELRRKTIKYLKWEDVPNSDRNLVRHAFNYARTKYPLPIEGQLQIVVTGNNTEGGMPHTHGNMIYIPLIRIQESGEEELTKIMIHEMSHIHQRQKKFLWEQLYHNLGIHHLPIEWTEPNEIREKILANPDTWEGGKWEYKGQHGVIILNDDAKTIKDHHYQVIPVRAGVDMSVNLWKKDFGMITQQIDHPAEVTATALEKYISTGNAGTIEITNTLRCWLEDCRRKEES